MFSGIRESDKAASVISLLYFMAPPFLMVSTHAECRAATIQAM